MTLLVGAVLGATISRVILHSSEDTVVLGEFPTIAQTEIHLANSFSFSEVVLEAQGTGYAHQEDFDRLDDFYDDSLPSFQKVDYGLYVFE